MARCVSRGAVAAAVAVLLAGCGARDGSEVAVPDGAEQGQLVEGAQATLEGEVQEVLGPRSFTVGVPPRFVYTAQDVVVEPGDHVVVTGTVEMFAGAAVGERQASLGDTTQFLRFAHQPALRAAEVRISRE